jgi:hypothetical protein
VVLRSDAEIFHSEVLHYRAAGNRRSSYCLPAFRFARFVVDGRQFQTKNRVNIDAKCPTPEI